MRQVEQGDHIFYSWGLFYAIGGGDDMPGWALQEWNAITRFCDDGIVSREHARFEAQIHNEYYNHTEWHHQGAGNIVQHSPALSSSRPAPSPICATMRRRYASTPDT